MASTSSKESSALATALTAALVTWLAVITTVTTEDDAPSFSTTDDGCSFRPELRMGNPQTPFLSWNLRPPSVNITWGGDGDDDFVDDDVPGSYRRRDCVAFTSSSNKTWCDAVVQNNQNLSIFFASNDIRNESNGNANDNVTKITAPPTTTTIHLTTNAFHDAPRCRRGRETEDVSFPFDVAAVTLVADDVTNVPSSIVDVLATGNGGGGGDGDDDEYDGSLTPASAKLFITDDAGDCDSSLRLGLSIYGADCFVDEKLCNDRGRCVLHPSKAERCGFRCLCHPGFEGTYCNESNPDVCDGIGKYYLCKNGGRCISDVSHISGLGYKCECQPGFEGRDCGIAIDECISNPCGNRGKCFDRNDGYFCRCDRGFTGVRCENESVTCETTPSICDRDETCLQEEGGAPRCYPSTTTTAQPPAAGCLSSPCLHGGTCIDEETDDGGGFECDCPSSFAGIFCQSDLVDECLSNPCKNDGECLERPSSYVCICKFPYNIVGEDCSHRPCDKDQCYNEGTCIENLSLTKGFDCRCRPGFSGHRCEINVNDCDLYKDGHPCTSEHRGRCEDDVNGYRCLCMPGYTGGKCEKSVDNCIGHDCPSNATCVDKHQKYECKCLNLGFEGDRCNDDIDECSSPKPLCKNNAECINTRGSYTCVCSIGWTGRVCDNDINECRNSSTCPFGTSCQNRPGTYTCSCPDGMQDCLEISSVRSQSVSMYVHGGDRSKLGASLMDAKPTSTQLQIVSSRSISTSALLPCQSNPCQNEGNCFPRLGVDSDVEYLCVCEPPFEGIHCEKIAGHEVFRTTSNFLSLTETNLFSTSDFFKQKYSTNEIEASSYQLISFHVTQTPTTNLVQMMTTRVSISTSIPTRLPPEVTHSRLYSTISPSKSIYLEKTFDNVTNCSNHDCLQGYCINVVEAEKPHRKVAHCLPREEMKLPCDLEWACENDGECKNSLKDNQLFYICKCRIGFSGRRCEIEESIFFPQFIDGSFLMHQSEFNDYHRNKTVFYFEFIPLSNNGLLSMINFYKSSIDFFVVFVMKNYGLEVFATCHHKNEFKSIKTHIEIQSPLNYGDYSLLEISMLKENRRYFIHLIVNGKQPVSIECPILNQLWSNETTVTFSLGGTPDHFHEALYSNFGDELAGFNGCIQNLMFLGEERDIVLSANRASGHVKNCQLPVENNSTLCDFSPCKNGAICSENVISSRSFIAHHEIECSCLKGYDGSFCQRKICEHNPCSENSICMPSIDNTSAVCHCSYGWHGEKCRQKVQINHPNFLGSFNGLDSFLEIIIDGLEHRFEFWLVLKKGVPIRKEEELLMYFGPQVVSKKHGDFFKLVVDKDGFVLFTYDLGSGIVEIKSFLSFYDNRNENGTFTLVFGRQGKDGWLNLKNTSSQYAMRNVTATSPGVLSSLNNPKSTTLLVGGLPEKSFEMNEKNNSGGFLGCILEMWVRNSYKEFWSKWKEIDLSSKSNQISEGRSVIDCESNCTINNDFCSSPVKLLMDNDECKKWPQRDECILNGGTCKPNSYNNSKIVASCLCPYGRGGKLCTENLSFLDPTFASEAMSKLMLTPVNMRKKNIIQIFFKPKYTNQSTLFFYVSQNRDKWSGDFLFLGIRYDTIVYLFNTGDDTIVLEIRFETIPYVWHELIAGRNSSAAWLNLHIQNATLSLEKMIKPGSFQNLDTTTEIFVGGFPDFSHLALDVQKRVKISKSFDGKIGKIIINGKDMNLTPLKNDLPNTFTCVGKDDGIYQHDKYCYNFFTCRNQMVEINSRLTCYQYLSFHSNSVECSRIFKKATFSDHCMKEKNPDVLTGFGVQEDYDKGSCGLSNCRNGGKCISNISGGNDFGCLCSDMFGGKRCETPIACFDKDDYKCKNGGRCLAKDTVKSICICPIGWEADLCAIKSPPINDSFSFSENSYLQFQLPGTARDAVFTNISFDFFLDSNTTSGLLVWNGQPFTEDQDFMGVALTHEPLLSIIFTMNLGYRSSIVKEILKGNSSFIWVAKKWYHFSMQRQGRQLEIEVENGPHSIFNVDGSFTELNAGDLFYFGGLKPSNDIYEMDENLFYEETQFLEVKSLRGHFEKTFEGCLKNIYVQGVKINSLSSIRGGNLSPCS